MVAEYNKLAYISLQHLDGRPCDGIISMRSGVSYNVFNGEEHLLHSLRIMRENVDYINLVVQFTSNAGHPASQQLSEVLNQVDSEQLIDAIQIYTPDLSIPPVVNEHKKRTIGLQMAKASGVTHFMTMDCDEYYPNDEFVRAKEFIEERGIDASAVSTYLHIKRPIWRSREPDVTCCAFLTRITDHSEIIFNSPYPVLVDGTRRLHGDAARFHFFHVDMISMRHMNLVRKDDLRSKLRNSSNAPMKEFMEKVRSAYDGWQFGKTLLFPNKPPMDIVEVEDIFGIDKFFQ